MVKFKNKKIAFRLNIMKKSKVVTSIKSPLSCRGFDYLLNGTLYKNRKSHTAVFIYYFC